MTIIPITVPININLNSKQELSFRLATDHDCLFAFELKKAVDIDSITNEFGWDEELQWVLHCQEWRTGLPTIICLSGKPIGTYMLMEKSDQLYFSRFFIMPEHQNQGIGTKVMTKVVRYSESQCKPCSLSYLQGNYVASLYTRMGFHITFEEPPFIYMEYTSPSFHKNNE